MDLRKQGRLMLVVFGWALMVPVVCLLVIAGGWVLVKPLLILFDGNIKDVVAALSMVPAIMGLLFCFYKLSQ